ncbi:MAG: ABC transporter substrate-binding protein [Chloroflexota bacterium]
MRKLYALLSLFILASMVLAACGPTMIETPAVTQPIVNAWPTLPGDPIWGYDTFYAAVVDEPETLDPALGYDNVSNEIIQNVYETLVFYDGEATDKFVPMLAESWKVSDDGTVYTFKIRSGVQFHNGADLTASDVAYSFQRGLLFGGYKGPQWLLAEPFFGIGIDDITLLFGPNPCEDRECLYAVPAEYLLAACEKVVNAIVSDDETATVTMTLAQAWAPFIATIAQPWGSVMDRDWTIANGGWDGDCATWQNYYAEPAETDPLSTIMNGTGPFELDHWTQGEELILVRNDNYWREPAKLNRVVFRTVDEWDTRYAMLWAGDADFAFIPPSAYAQMDNERVGEIRVFDMASNRYGKPQEVCGYDATRKGVEKFTVCAEGEEGKGASVRLYIGRPGTSRSDLFFTFQIAESSNYVGSGRLDGNGIPLDFFSDVHIRRAFAYCFDWNAYVNQAFDGEAIQSPVVPLAGMPGYEADAPVYAYDASKCEAEFKRADLDKDGVPAGDDPEGDVWTVGFRLPAIYNQGNAVRQIVAEIFARNLASVNELFVVETVGLPWPTFVRTIRAREAPYFVTGWTEDIHDPHNWYYPYTIGAYAERQNLPSDLRAQFSDLVYQGLAESDPAKRQAIYEQLNRLFYEQVPVILLAVETTRRYEQRWVQGAILNPVFPGYYYLTIYKD